MMEFVDLLRQNSSLVFDSQVLPVPPRVGIAVEVDSGDTNEVAANRGIPMHETTGEPQALQSLLDRSYEMAGGHLKSIHTPSRRMSATKVCESLKGVCVLNLATVDTSGPLGSIIKNMLKALSPNCLNHTIGASMAHYIDGFVLPISRNRLEEYRHLVEAAAEIWKEHGALDYREYVGDDLDRDGTRSFSDLVAATEGEAIVFGWVVFDSREARDSANEKVAADPRMAELVSMSKSGFDAERMAYGGFRSLLRPSPI